MGFSFHKYYLTPQEKGTIENQPESTFIGYCFKNNKFIDFLNFLITFLLGGVTMKGAHVLILTIMLMNFFILHGLLW